MVFILAPRISIANALSLGMTSSGEIVDFELREKMDIDDFCQRLSDKLPTDIPIYQVAEIDVKAPAASRLLEKAEYLITLTSSSEITAQQWQDWLDLVNSSTEIIWEKITKSGKKQQVNLRERLFRLTIESSNSHQVVLRYLGSCRNDGTILSPENLVYMLEQISNQDFQLLHAHRQQILLTSE